MQLRESILNIKWKWVFFCKRMINWGSVMLLPFTRNHCPHKTVNTKYGGKYLWDAFWQWIADLEWGIGIIIQCQNETIIHTWDRCKIKWYIRTYGQVGLRPFFYYPVTMCTFGLYIHLKFCLLCIFKTNW